MSSSKRLKILFSRSFMSGPKSSGVGVFPGPPGIGEDPGAGGINDLGPPADLISGTQNCRHCGDPIDGPPVLTAAHPELPGLTHKRLEE